MPPSVARSSTRAASFEGAAPRRSTPWKRRVEEPLNRFVHYPIAHGLVRLLVKTPVTANQVTLVQPLIALVAAYLVTFDDFPHLLAGVLVFQLRSLLDCVDGTLARAKRTASPNGHAMDALCDWLSVVVLYGGIVAHLERHPPSSNPVVPVALVVAASLAQGALRSAAADYYASKLTAIFEKGHDAAVDELRKKQLALGPETGFLARAEALMGRCQHRLFEGETFDPRRTMPLPPEAVARIRAAEHGRLTRVVATLWSVSNGDFFITLTLVSVLLGFIWEAQVLFATVGVVWIVGVIAFSRWYLRRVRVPRS